jgi:hypothetical protein
MRIGRGKRSTRKKTCPSAILSIENSAWSDPGSNPGHRGGKPATNRLKERVAFIITFTFLTSWFIQPWRRRKHCPAKRRCLTTRLHEIIPYKLEIFVVNKVRDSDLTRILGKAAGWMAEIKFPARAEASVFAIASGEVLGPSHCRVQ